MISQLRVLKGIIVVPYETLSTQTERKQLSNYLIGNVFVTLCRYDVTNFIDERQRMQPFANRGAFNRDTICRETYTIERCGIEDWLNRVVRLVVAIHVSFSERHHWTRIACEYCVHNFATEKRDTYHFLTFQRCNIYRMSFPKRRRVFSAPVASKYIPTVYLYFSSRLRVVHLVLITWCYIRNSIAEHIPHLDAAGCCEWTHEGIRGSGTYSDHCVF